MNLIFFFFFLLLAFLPPSHSTSCSADTSVLTSAFASVSNFIPPPKPQCPLTTLRLSSRNLTGTVSWTLLSSLRSLRFVDLSNNSLAGSLPSSFLSSPSLRHLNLSHNRLGGPLRFASTIYSSLTLLDLSSNRFTSLSRLDTLRNLTHLDLSCNSVRADINKDLLENLDLKFLNVSYNKFYGNVGEDEVRKFGRSAFVKAGSLTFSVTKHRHKLSLLFVVIIIVVSTLVAILGVIVGWVVLRRRKWRGWKEEERGVKLAEEVPTWVAEARWAAPVVVFDKPLLELKFSDLAAATSGFGRESMLAEGGRSGPAYRAVLPGDLDVVVRVVTGAREMEEGEAAEGYREMAKLRHQNLLPLLGYCIAGKEKLLLYEYMPRGDLHRWLHELPSGRPDVVEDYTNPIEAWDPQDCPARHRVALGIARGLAFLHQGWVGSTGRPIVHGHLVPSNVLLTDDSEPRISDFDLRSARGTAEGDVYSYGVLVMELVTGKGEDDVERIRKSFKEGKFSRKLKGSERKWEEEMLRVAYLCTAPSPEMRPTMQQVVGLVKDIRCCT